MGFFKAYDMRGTFGIDFDLDLVYRVGLNLPKVVGGPRWLVGRDCRTTSGAVRDALVRGLTDAGAKIEDIGLCSTPMVYFFTAEDGYDGSIMITASHNPPTDNGLKVSKRGALPVGYANGLCEVERLAIGRSDANPSNVERTEAHSRKSSYLSRYIDWQLRQSDIQRLNSLKIGVDCSNGMASLFAKEVFPGAEIINDTLDGAFPCHSPNPLKAEARAQIANLVREKGLDCGVVFDGDADRAMFVDENGQFVQPDYLVPIVARATLSTHDCKNPKIIHDVRTSRGAIDAIKALGAEPVMVPVGHAFAKPILRETGALCGGELAGHYYFREFHCCDSGLLAATRILSEVAKAKAKVMTFSEMMTPITDKYANSGEINFKVEDKEGAICRVLDAAASRLPREVSRSEMDGVRIEYEEGWFCIRKSNTEPYLRLIAECDTKARLEEWISIMKDAIEA